MSTAALTIAAVLSDGTVQGFLIGALGACLLVTEWVSDEQNDTIVQMIDRVKAVEDDHERRARATDRFVVSHAAVTTDVLMRLEEYDSRAAEEGLEKIRAAFNEWQEEVRR